MDHEYTYSFALRKRTPVILGGFGLLMLVAFPLLSPQIAALFNVTLVVVANLLGFWRWGLAATAWTLVITWVMDTLFWQVGFAPSVYISGGTFNLGLTLVFGTALAAKNRHMITDGLTGLFDDNHFRNVLKWEVERANRYQRPLSLVMIDLDAFKPLNDRHGHLAGDQVLRDFAQLLRATARGSDLVARYGGDEFALILPETERAGAEDMIERIRQAKRGEWHFDGRAVTVSASMGAAQLKPGQTGGQLLREADQALYADKQRRRSQAPPS